MLSLENCSREAVQEITVFAVVPCEAVFHEVAHQFIRNEKSLLHVFLCRLSEGSALLDVGAEYVSGGDVQHIILFRNISCLSALSHSGRA